MTPRPPIKECAEYMTDVVFVIVFVPNLHEFTIIFTVALKLVYNFAKRFCCWLTISPPVTSSKFATLLQ